MKKLPARSTTPVETKLCWVGTAENFIAIDYERLPFRQVALHAEYHVPTDGLYGEFDYIVVTAAEAYQTLSNLVEEAALHLYDRGHAIDTANNSPKVLLDKLRHDLLGQLH